MRTRWFADPAEGERLDETLLRLVGAISRMLDGLASPPVAPGTGRIDAAKMTALFDRWIDPRSVDAAFICGPEPMMLTVAQSLRDQQFNTPKGPVFQTAIIAGTISNRSPTMP